MPPVQDLKRYPFCLEEDPRVREALAVGWLWDRFDFERETPKAAYLARLRLLCLDPIDLDRGVHDCMLCGLHTLVPGCPYYGNGSILVSHRGTDYIAPTLVLHYVEDHHYKAPDGFIAGVMATPLGASSRLRLGVHAIRNAWRFNTRGRWYPKPEPVRTPRSPSSPTALDRDPRASPPP